MRIKKDVLTQKLVFVGIDSSDHITRKTGLSSFTVYYSLNGGAATVMTTPTVAELDATNMAGDYTLLVDEAGQASAAGELTLHITASGMDAVTRIVEITENFEADNYAVVAHADYGNAKLVRSTTPANALDVSATGEAGLDFANIKDATGAHTLTNITVPVTTAVTNEVTADAVKISGDSTAANNAELAFDGTGYGFANCTIPTVTTLTGHTAQTGDSFARIGAAGASLTDLGGMSSGMQTEVNNQVVDVIRTDTTSEMSQGAPPATPTFEEMVAYVYFRLRNKRVVSETEDATYDDAGTTKLFKAAVEEVSDVFTKSEYVTGA